MAEQIDLGFAVALAGQVSAGLAEGEGQPERANASLLAIGLMLKNAARDDLVDDVLALAGSTHVTEYGAGVARFEVVGGGEEPR